MNQDHPFDDGAMSPPLDEDFEGGPCVTPGDQLEPFEEDRWLCVLIPSTMIGTVIGKGGETIKHIRDITKCQVNTEKNETIPGYRLVTIKGKRCWEAFAEGIIASLEEKQRGQDTDVIFCMPRQLAGNIMGVKGATINDFRQRFGGLQLQMQDAGKTLRYFQMKGEYDELRSGLTHFYELYFQAKFWQEGTPRIEDFQPATANQGAGGNTLRELIGNAPRGGNPPVPPMLGRKRGRPDDMMGAPMQQNKRHQPMGNGGNQGFVQQGGMGGGHPDQTQTIELQFEDNSVGKIIGKGGQGIKSVRELSGCRLETDNQSQSVNGFRGMRITGTLRQVGIAIQMIDNILHQ